MCTAVVPYLDVNSASTTCRIFENQNGCSAVCHCCMENNPLSPFFPHPPYVTCGTHHCHEARTYKRLPTKPMNVILLLHSPCQKSPSTMFGLNSLLRAPSRLSMSLIHHRRWTTLPMSSVREHTLSTLLDRPTYKILSANLLQGIRILVVFLKCKWLPSLGLTGSNHNIS